MKKALVEVSVIKNLGANCVNRDDLGSPKTVNFGGYTRGRYSTQSKKHEMRMTEVFESLMGGTAKSIRTRKIYIPVLEELRQQGLGEDFVPAVDKLLSFLGKAPKEVSKSKGKKADKEATDGGANEESDDNATATKSGTGQIMAYSKGDILTIVEVVKGIVDEYESVDKLNAAVNKTTTFNSMVKALNEGVSKKGATGINLDTALFGRMAATKSLTNVEASMQVAHAFSTNAIVNESDFFVAIDDLTQDAGEQGSAMMGDVQYNASCYYEYANLDVDALRANLSINEIEEAELLEIVGAVVELFLTTTPRGKQNTFAAHSLPSAIMVEVKSKKSPLNYANAFVKPVRPTKEQDIVEGSVSKLVSEVDKMEKCYDLGVVKRFWVNLTGDNSPANCVVCTSLKEVVEGVVATLAE